MSLVVSGRASQEQTWGVMNDYLRSAYGLRALHPLSEGIALFAEHEVVPETSTHISAVMQSALAYFQRDTVKQAGLTEAVTRLLVGARCTPEGIRRKAAVFEQPLWTGGSRGGYLAGYLTVKNLWFQIAHACSRFGDSDLFLQYFYLWFFHDWKLVHHLLDPSTADIVACDRISEHLALRFNALSDAPHAEVADRLEARASSSDADERDPMRFVIDTPEDVVATAQQELRAITDEVMRTTTDDKPELAARNLARAVFARRPLMLLGRSAVTVDIESGDVLVRIEGKRTLMVPRGIEPVPEDGSGDGMLEVFAVPTDDNRPIVFCVWRGQRLVGMTVSHGACGIQAPSFPVDVVDRSADRLLQSVLWVIGAGSEHQLEVARIYLKGLDRVQFEAFAPTALAFAKPSRSEAAANAMREFGFLPILGGADMVWALAFIGVLNKTTIPTEHLAGIYTEFGGTAGFSEAFEAVQAASRKAFGQTLIYGEPSRYLALV